MTTKQAMMPMLAQTFVDSQTGIHFDAVKASSPRRPSPRKRRVDALTDPSKTDIFSLSDAVLAERYQFIAEIGFGNWGSVWRCKRKTDPKQGSTISIKLVHRSKNPTSSARVRSLWQEFKCIRGLRDTPHPNIIAFHTFIITPSYALITMAHHPRCIPVALPEDKAAVYFRQLVSAVDYLHAHGYSHNDIKPANILLSEEDVPILIDFGFAQHYSLSSTESFLSQLSWGTPEYLDPLRARGSLHDERLSDVWALGVTMYEIVVGRTPFEKNDAEEFLTRDALEVYYHRTTTGEFCGEYNISREFESLISWMVCPDVSKRLQVCGKALRHPFFDPLGSSLSSKPSLAEAFNARMASTPKRVESRAGTPSSSAKKVATPQRRIVKAGDRRDSVIKVYQDPSTPTPARSAPTTPASGPTFSPRPLVLGERNGTPSVTPSRKGTPSKAAASAKSPPVSRIPIRKIDISSPVNLPKTAFAEHRRTQSAYTTPSRSVSGVTKGTLPPVVTPKSSLRKASIKRITSTQKETPPPVPSLDEPLASQVESAAASAENDEREVLASSQGSARAPGRKSGFNGDDARSSSPSTPLSPCFASSPTTVTFRDSVSVSIRAGEGVVESTFPSSERWDIAAAYGRTSPLTVSNKPSSSSLTSKFRKLSVRKAPSTFFSLKSSIAHVGRRRASTATSTFELVDSPLNAAHSDRDAMTMPIELASKSPVDLENEKARLESFSRHIQHIIDARKGSQPPLPRRSVQPKPSTPDEERTEMSILSPVEVQEFAAQVAQELAEESRQKSMSREAFGPRPSRSASTCRRAGASSSQIERPPARIRPSLAPSFVGKASPPKIKSTPPRLTSPSVSSFASASSNAVEFRPGHRRIPTAIRDVPPIYLTESGDEFGSDSEYSRAETPCSERPLSPTPAARIVEEGRILPTWVPASDSEDEGDVDEPTVTLATPPRIKKPSKHSPTKKRTPRTTPQPSTDSLYQQFVNATPHIDRQFRIGATAVPQAPSASNSPYHEPVNFEEAADTRASSRASTWASQKSHTRSRSVLSFLFSGSSSRASMSIESLSAVETEEDAPKKRKGGKFRRALKKILQ